RMTEGRRRGFLAGVIAGLPMALAMFALASTIGLPTLPDLFADPILFLLPGPIFGVLIDKLQFLAKSLLLVGLLEGQLVVCGLVGRAWAAHGWNPLAMVLVIWVGFETVGLALLGRGLLEGAIGYGALFLVYALVLPVVYGWLDDHADAARRRF